MQSNANTQKIMRVSEAKRRSDPKRSKRRDFDSSRKLKEGFYVYNQQAL